MNWDYGSRSSGFQSPLYTVTTGFLKNKPGTPPIPQDSAIDAYGPADHPDSTPHQLCMVSQAQQQLSNAAAGQLMPKKVQHYSVWWLFLVVSSTTSGIN